MPKKKKQNVVIRNTSGQAHSAAPASAGSAGGKRADGTGKSKSKSKSKSKGKGRKSTKIRKKNVKKMKNKKVDEVAAAAAAAPVNYAELGEELLRNVNLRPSDSRGLDKANALYQHPSTKGVFLSMVHFSIYFSPLCLLFAAKFFVGNMMCARSLPELQKLKITRIVFCQSSGEGQ